MFRAVMKKEPAVKEGTRLICRRRNKNEFFALALPCF